VFLVGVQNLPLDDVSTFSKIGIAPPSPSRRLEVVVVSSRQFRHAVRAKVADHFELLLTTAGVVFALMLTFSQLDRGTQGLAFTFLVWLQGFLIWAVRRHSRLARARLVRQLRVMLQDRVNNQLTVLLGVAELQAHESDARGEDGVETAMAAAREVARELDSLSLESLRAWESRYARFLPTPLR
jgi:hypothetical protein